VPNLEFYPASISVALGVAAAVSYFTGVPPATAVILVLAGLVVAGFTAYRPEPPESASEPPARRFLQAQIAKLIRLAVGTLVIAIVTIAALRVADLWFP